MEWWKRALTVGRAAVLVPTSYSTSILSPPIVHLVVTSIHYVQSCTRRVGPQAQTVAQRTKTRDRTIIEKYIRETDVVLG